MRDYFSVFFDMVWHYNSVIPAKAGIQWREAPFINAALSGRAGSRLSPG
jgi:hypothetical protein